MEKKDLKKLTMNKDEFYTWAYMNTLRMKPGETITIYVEVKDKEESESPPEG